MPITPTETYTPTKQEFLNSVLNKFGKQEFSNVPYTNPLKRLRGGMIEGATDIEEIYIDRAEDKGYIKEGTGVLDRNTVTTHVQYHNYIKEHGYATTVSNKQMRRGFLNKGNLETMAQGIINSLHTGNELDDYQDCIDTLKALVASPKKEKNNVITVKSVTDETTAKEFTKEVKKTLLKMTEYTKVYSDMPSYAKPSDLILFIDSDVEVEINIESLASAFNMSVADITELTKIVVPNLKTKIGAIGVIAHHKCLKINPCYYDLDSIKNTKGKFVNYDLVTETMLSFTTWFPFAILTDNAAAFTKMSNDYHTEITKLMDEQKAERKKRGE